MENTIKGIASGKPNAIMGVKLAAEYVVESGYQIPFIYNLTASTLLSEHTRKTAVLCVENALVAGADCVAAHINFSSRYENEMLCSFSQIANECDRLGMPLLAIAYPRSERNGKDYNYEDMIKGNQDAYAELRLDEFGQNRLPVLIKPLRELVLEAGDTVRQEYFPEITKEKAERLSKQQFIEDALYRIEGHASNTLDDLTEGRALITDRDAMSAT